MFGLAGCALSKADTVFTRRNVSCPSQKRGMPWLNCEASQLYSRLNKHSTPCAKSPRSPWHPRPRDHGTLPGPCLRPCPPTTGDLGVDTIDIYWARPRMLLSILIAQAGPRQQGVTQLQRQWCWGRRTGQCLHLLVCPSFSIVFFSSPSSLFLLPFCFSFSHDLFPLSL